MESYTNLNFENNLLKKICNNSKSLYVSIANNITFFIDYIYYNNLKKIYKSELAILFVNKTYPIVMPEFFIYLQYYFTYEFFYYLNKQNIFLYSLSLHMMYINNLIYNNLCKKYKYTSQYNVKFLINTNYAIFAYFLFLKIMFLDTLIYNKIIFNLLLSIFCLLTSINNVYEDRLLCINNKKEINHPFKILIITSSKKLIENIAYKTRFFSFENLLIFTNILLYFYI